MSVGGKNKLMQSDKCRSRNLGKKENIQKSKNGAGVLGQMQKLADKLGAQLTVADEIIEKKLKKNLLH